jgi:Fe-S-cluster-containing hydrogenase component 2
MDVFRFSEEQNKSIIAYPENCQACGMCFYVCMGNSLQISLHSHMFPIMPMSVTSGIDMNHFIYASPGVSGAEVRDRLGKTGKYESESSFE